LSEPSEQSQPPVEWFVEGIIDRERKLSGYLLSSTHPDGRNKLRLWRSVFGIDEGDAELLERLIREQLEQATPEERLPKKVMDPDGTVRQWELIIPRFRGPNGNEGPVKTGWALDPSNDRPHLSTAYPVVG